jgi:glycosyltransferase involved in cell wall biosynthesis
MLVQAVESALNQTYEDYELIVVDDGSESETRKALEPYMGRIRYIYQENAGPSAARNRGLRDSDSELVAFLDHDDLWLPEKLQTQVEYMESQKNYSLTYHRVDYFNEERTLDFPVREGPEGDVLATLFKRIFLITLAVMCRRNCFDKAGYFDEELRFAQDYEIWLRMALHHEFGYIDSTLGRYRFHEGNLSRENQIRHFTEKMITRERIYSDPKAQGRIPYKLYRREIASVTFKLAKMYLEKDKPDKAREMIAKSIHFRPIEPRRWLFWLRTRFA